MGNEKTGREELAAQLVDLGVPFRKNATEKTLQKLLDAQAIVVTQRHLDENPDLVGEGLEVGDTAYLPFSDDVSDAPEVKEEVQEVKEEVQEDAPKEEEKPTVDVEGSRQGSYKAVRNIKVNGNILEPGTVVELTHEVATQLLKSGAVEQA